LGDRHHRGAHHTAIDQLARGEPLGVRRAKHSNLARFDGNEVGGGGADIDEERFPMTLGRERGTCVPIGRGDLQRLRLRRGRRKEAGIAGINQHRDRRRGLDHQVDEVPDTVRSALEHIGQLAGHGHGVDRRRPDQRQRRRNGLIEFGAVGDKRAGDLGHGLDAAVLDDGELYVGAPHIPADYPCHGVPIAALVIPAKAGIQ
jgi:hypothetical protein